MAENINSSNSLNRIRNIVLAFVAIALSLALVIGLQTNVNSESLEAQAEKATPLEIAVNNNKPSLVEFYANWCTSCQAMAGDLAQLKQEYQEQINFVMLNVDNSKWLPEVLNYQVDGIPHFVFLDNEGKSVAEAIGEQPLTIFQSNLQALLTNEPLPYANSTGNNSNCSREEFLQGNTDDPRNHG